MVRSLRRNNGNELAGLDHQCIVYVELLKDCMKRKDLSEATKLHSQISETGLIDRSFHIVSSLISTYAKCDAILVAQQVFQDINAKNVVIWNALIAGFTQQGHGKEALQCFEKLQIEGLLPNVVTFICALKACSHTLSFARGKQIHTEILRNGMFGKDVVLNAALVNVYAKCGALAEARQVLEELPVCDTVTWNTLIAGYVEHGQDEEVLVCFHHMRVQGMAPDGITFTYVLKACGRTRNAKEGHELHSDIICKGVLGTNVVLGTCLIDMYAKCGAMAEAEHVLGKLPVRDSICWNSLIAGYVQQGHYSEALKCVELMQNQSFCADAITCVLALQACGNTGDLNRGKEIHDYIDKNRLMSKDVALGTTLVDMYFKCGAIDKAEELFDKLPTRNIVSWNMLITGYVQHGRGEEVLNCFEMMKCEGLYPDTVTFSCILKACGLTGDIERGQQIHHEIKSKNLIEDDVILGNVLVDMYAKFGMLIKAEEVFHDLHTQNIGSWNSIITAYVQQGENELALRCLNHMDSKGVSPNILTLVVIVKACGSLGAIDKGKQVHNVIMSKGLFGKDVKLCTGLVDMYVKCGDLAKARQVFESLPFHNTYTWNALIAGYSQHGEGRKALDCFHQMQLQGFSPDTTTFLCLINACSHSGLLYEGGNCLVEMNETFYLLPDLDHFTCMVDLCGRLGNLEKAMAVIKNLHAYDYPPLWGALLGACRKRGDLEVGKLAFEQALKLNKDNAAAFSSISNIYLAADFSGD